MQLELVEVRVVLRESGAVPDFAVEEVIVDSVGRGHPLVIKYNQITSIDLDSYTLRNDDIKLLEIRIG